MESVCTRDAIPPASCSPSSGIRVFILSGFPAMVSRRGRLEIKRNGMERDDERRRAGAKRKENICRRHPLYNVIIGARARLCADSALSLPLILAGCAIMNPQAPRAECAAAAFNSGSIIPAAQPRSSTAGAMPSLLLCAARGGAMHFVCEQT